MGLDMYLTGERNFSSRRTLECQLVAEHYSLGYWRKHPNLHGYIVDHFAAGNDDCSPIGLDATWLRQILHAVETDHLPETKGFFFGTSNGSEKPHDISVLTHAIAWLEAPDEHAYRTVTYQASW